MYWMKEPRVVWEIRLSFSMTRSVRARRENIMESSRKKLFYKKKKTNPRRTITKKKYTLSLAWSVDRQKDDNIFALRKRYSQNDRTYRSKFWVYEDVFFIINNMVNSIVHFVKYLKRLKYFIIYVQRNS